MFPWGWQPLHLGAPFIGVSVEEILHALIRWYHGRITRQMACERLLEVVGEPGGYLVRESVGQPGDYAISYLSHLGQVHHFKINSNCGDYYIGGRQFYSLNDLIGFYANCSCILENESLEVPVVPPKVSPHYGWFCNGLVCASACWALQAAAGFPC